MKKIRKRTMETELERGDLPTTLIRIADRLSGQSLALTGIAFQDSEPGQPEFRILTEMADGMTVWCIRKGCSASLRIL